jgi:hypothetical protein
MVELSETHHLRKLQSMGFAEFIIGPAEGRTRWLCAEHDRQLGGESLLSSLIVAKD